MFDGVCHTSSPTNDCRTAFEPSLHISVPLPTLWVSLQNSDSGSENVRIDEDARDYERLPTDFPFTLVHNEITVVKGRVSEISMSGCTLQTDMPMQLGQVIDLKLYISNDPIMIDSLVIRNTSANRAGVEFLRFGESERTRLQFFIRQERCRNDLKDSEIKQGSTVAA
jgi:hypothetical protein